MLLVEFIKEFPGKDKKIHSVGSQLHVSQQIYEIIKDYVKILKVLEVKGIEK